MRFWPRWWPRRVELADALGALEETRAELAGARERIAELEARLRQTPGAEGFSKQFGVWCGQMRLFGLTGIGIGS